MVSRLALLVVGLVALWGAPQPIRCVAAGPGGNAPTPAKEGLPRPGETFTVAGCQAFLIPPERTDPARPTPWVWYAPTLKGLPGKSEEWMTARFAAAGIAVAGIDVGESYGSPEGRAKYSALYDTLVRERKMATKPILLGRSRGGLMLLCWAAENADRVGGFAGIYPVCNIASYPGIEKAAPAYGLTGEQLRVQLSQHNPPDRLQALAKAKVPFFAIHGDVDTVVPLVDNSALLKSRITELGGTMTLVVPTGQGHNMWPGFFECQELVDFVIRCAGVDAR